MFQDLLRIIGFRTPSARRLSIGRLGPQLTRLQGEFLEERNLLAAALISVIDNSDVNNDATIAFTTLLSNGGESNLVRPGLPDGRHYIDVTNSGDAPLTLFEIEVNSQFEFDVGVFDVTIDTPLTSNPADDIVLAPSESRRFTLTFSPSSPNNMDPGHYDFDLSDGLLIHSNATNTTSLPVRLIARSTFRADVDYNGIVAFQDFAILNNTFGAVTGDPDYHPSIDMDFNGIVNFNDFAILNVEFGRDINNPPPIIAEDFPLQTSKSAGFVSESSDDRESSPQASVATQTGSRSELFEDHTILTAEEFAQLAVVAGAEAELEDDPPSAANLSSNDTFFEELGGGIAPDQETSTANLTFDEDLLNSILQASIEK